jgi:hypothetical protein
MTQEIIAFIEKDQFYVNGICTVDFCASQVDSKTLPDGSVNIEIPMQSDDGYDPSCQNTIAYLIPDGKTEIECLFCAPPCDEIKTDLSTVPSIPSLPVGFKDSSCLSKCTGQIRWSEDAQIHERLSGNISRSLNTLTTEVDIPQICGLTGLEFRFELSPCFGDWDFKGSGMIPQDNSLQRIHDGKYRITWPFTSNDACFKPGEYMIVYGKFKTPAGRCYPLPLAYGWYETRCLTSGIIAGAGLLSDSLMYTQAEQLSLTAYNEELQMSQMHIKQVRVYGFGGVVYPPEAYSVDHVNGKIRIPAGSPIPRNVIYVDFTWVWSQVVAGGYNEPLMPQWVSDTRLHWLVWFKGRLTWLKCSDYTAWTIGDRCLIYKDGLSALKSGRKITAHKCRLSDGTSPDGDDILSDSCVAYAIDKEKDVILPFKVG